VLVNRESMIRYETNSYSVPPEHIGQLLLLKVHPFEADAESSALKDRFGAFHSRRMVRKRNVSFRRIGKNYKNAGMPDRARLARVRKPRVPKSQNSSPEVEVRPTSAYEELFADQAMGGLSMNEATLAMDTLTTRMEELGLGFMSASLATFLGASGRADMPLLDSIKELVDIEYFARTERYRAHTAQALRHAAGETAR